MSQWYRVPVVPTPAPVFTLPTDVMGYEDMVDLSHVVRSEPLFDVLNGAGMLSEPPADWVVPSDRRFRMCTPPRWYGVGGEERKAPNGWHGPPDLSTEERGLEPFVGPRFGGPEEHDFAWYHADNDDYTNMAFRLYATYRGRDPNAASARLPPSFSVTPHNESRPPHIFNIPRYHPGHRVELSYIVHLRTRMAFVLLVGSAQRISMFEEYEGYSKERLGNIVITGFCGPYQGLFLFRMRTRNHAGLPFRLDYPRYLLVPREYVLEERLWPMAVAETEMIDREWRLVMPGGRNEQVFDQEIASGRGTSFSGQFEMLGVRDSQDYPNRVLRGHSEESTTGAVENGESVIEVDEAGSETN